MCIAFVLGFSAVGEDGLPQECLTGSSEYKESAEKLTAVCCLSIFCDPLSVVLADLFYYI